MKQPPRPRAIPRYLRLFFVVLALSFTVLLFSQRWVIRTVRTEKEEQALSMLQLVRTTSDLSVDQVFKLSQLLLLDNTTSKFMYQRPIEGGSGEIQTLIDAKSVLPTATSVNAILSEIYLYSNRNGYILCSQNAFLDPELMYPSLFAFEGLNYRQFRSRYLSASFTQAFFPETRALVHGRERRVIPFIQTFPLNNPSSNAGKIVFLLDAAYFHALLSDTVEGLNQTIYITDSNEQLITYSGDASLILEERVVDGQHRRRIDGEEYLISALSSDSSGLRFHSVLSLKEVNGLLNPMWLVVASISVGLFILIALVSFILLLRSNRQWNELLGLAGDGEKHLPYEQAATYISSIVTKDRNQVRQMGGTPFITDTFFRRLIHGRMLTAAEISAMLKQVQADIDLSSPLVYQMLHITSSSTLELLSDEILEDLDFMRIAAARTASDVFGIQHYLYMDASFSIWVMLWSTDLWRLSSAIEHFAKTFTAVSPLSVTIAVSNPKRQIDDIFQATVECTEVQQYLKREGAVEQLVRFEELSFSRDPYHYTAEMDRKLHAAVIRGDTKGADEILESIRRANYQERTLAGDEHKNLMRALYASAVHLAQGVRSALPSAVFESFEEAARFYGEQAQAVGQAKSDSEEILTDRIISYIDEHYQDPSLNLSHMASSFGMKESFLYHFMMTRMDSSFAQHLETHRLERSRAIFGERQISIAEVSTMVGYANPQTFRRAFQKRYGILPSEYQRTVLYQKREH